jgi:hypothetical protein
MQNKILNIPEQYEKIKDSSVVTSQHENITIPNDTQRFLDSHEG